MILDLVGSLDTHNKKIALSYINWPYAVFNVTAAQNNNAFDYRIGTTTFNVVIPDGFYEIADLLSYFEFVLFNNNHYLLDGNSNPVYYLTWTVNRSNYRVTFTATSIPSVLPAGFTDPHNLITLNSPTPGATPQLITLNNKFGELLGLKPASVYPLVNSTTVQFNGDFAPDIATTSSINVGCNLVYNQLQGSESIFEFSPTGATFGSYVSIRPALLLFHDTNVANASQIRITFYNQLGNRVKMEDTDITIGLIITSDK